MKSIYIILTKSESLPSKLITFFTHDKYTHASIAFDRDLRVMYSFARKYTHLPLPAGLVEERVDSGFWKNQQNIPCAVLKIDADDKTFFRLKYKIRKMLDRKDDFKYSLIGLIMCGMNIETDIPNNFFCSQFVAHVLAQSGAAEFDKPESLIHPSDFYSMDKFICIYEGKLHALKTKQRDLNTSAVGSV